MAQGNARAAKRSGSKRTVTKTGLTPAQEQAAALIGIGHTTQEAADAVGVSRVTIWRWLLEADFQKASAGYLEDVTRAARDRMRSLALKAVERVGEGLDAVKPVFMKETDGKGHTASVPVDDVPDHNNRLRAADAVLDRSGMPRRTETETIDTHKATLDEIGKKLRGE